MSFKLIKGTNALAILNRRKYYIRDIFKHFKCINDYKKWVVSGKILVFVAILTL